MMMDVNRAAFPTHSRTLNEYMNAFAVGLGQLNCEIVLFHDKTLTDRLVKGLSERNIRAKIEFCEISSDELPFAESDELLAEVLAGPAMRFFALRDSLFSAAASPVQIFRLLMNRALKRSLQIWDQLPVTDARAPEYKSPAYLQVTWSKAWTLLRTWELGIGGIEEPLVFADFGLGHGLKEFSETVKGRELDSTNLVHGKVNLTRRRELVGVNSPWHLAQELDDAAVPAGVFAGYLEPVRDYQKFLQVQVARYMEMGLAPDDQVMLALYASTHKENVHFMPQLGKFDGWYQLDFFLNKIAE
jgi:hypothetical protein